MFGVCNISPYIYNIRNKQKTKIMKTLKEKAQEIKEKGSPLTIDQIIAILEKTEASKAKRDKRSKKAWAKRDANEKSRKEIDTKLAVMTDREKADYFEDTQRRSILNQLPSSMR